jgi:S1-C subfamily serine protease
MNRKLGLFFILLIIVISATQVLAATKLTRLVKKIQPAVVTVIAYDMNNNVANIGTGFFADKNGELITNHHVLIGKYGAEVRTSDGKTYPVTSVVAENKPADLVKVLVGIPAGKFRWLEVSGDLPAIAQRVVVVGSPMGLDQTVSEGIVSSIREIPALGHFFQRIDPNFAPAHFNMGQAFLQQGNKVAALDQYKILKNIDQDAADKLFDLIY